MSRGKILKLSDLKGVHGSITLEYTGILYAGVDREKKLRELAKVNPQEYCLVLGAVSYTHLTLPTKLEV